LLPGESRKHRHYQCSVLPILHLNWDLLIGHPPCRFLCNSGVRWLAPGAKAMAEQWS
jgi:hypothetical protein